jgi:hypothetical protein
MKLGLIFSLCLFGCGPHIIYRVAPIQTPDGRRGFVIECRDYNICWEKAGHACPNGYDILESEATKVRKSNHNTTMVIECK